MEVHIHSQCSPFEACAEESGSGVGVSLNTLLFPPGTIQPMLSTCRPLGTGTIDLFEVAMPKDSVSISLLWLTTEY